MTPQTATAEVPASYPPDPQFEDPIEKITKTLDVGLSPQRRDDGRLEGINIRRAARLNAASIKQSEVDSLLRERAALVEKKFAGEFSQAEERRLNFVRWSLDRIQDARHGQALDNIEAAIARYESFRSEVQQLIDRLEEVGNVKIK